jgi:hypothetical protein
MKIITIIAFSLVAGSVLAAGDPPPPGPEKKKDAVIERYSEASARQDWTAAAKVMREGVAESPRNASYPKHRGAHEYIGEAYLMVGNVAKAKEHLAQLDKLCFFGCSEYSELKKAISEHETKTAAR